MIIQLESFCNYPDCKSDPYIEQDHFDHTSNIKIFKELSEELQKDDHILRSLKITSVKEDLDSFIDDEILKLSQHFEQVLMDLKIILKSYAAVHVQSLKDLVDLQQPVVENNQTKIEDLSYALPNLNISSAEIMRTKCVAIGVQQEIEKVLQEINKTIMVVIPKVNLNDPSRHNQWSSTLKQSTIEIIGKVAKTETGRFQMILIEPSFSMTDSAKVTLKMTQLKYHMIYISLCDVKIAESVRPTWDHRNNPGEGAYSLRNDGGVYPHHLEINQTHEQVSAFKFKEGDILELEWNGPQRQFILSNTTTMENYVQDVQFGENALLHFGVALSASSVEIVQ